MFPIEKLNVLEEDRRLLNAAIWVSAVERTVDR